MVKISTSLLSIEKTLVQAIKDLNKTNTDYLHIDIMDGKFVENKSFTFNEIKKISKLTDKPLDVHLMVKNPLKYINDYALLNVEYITFHLEAVKNPLQVIEHIKSTGIKCGISVKSTTKIKELFPFLKLIDLVLIMSVNPGYGNQAFNPDSIARIRFLKEQINKENVKVSIAVDGGINNLNAKECIQYGTDILVSGSFITNSSDYQKQIDLLKE